MWLRAPNSEALERLIGSHAVSSEVTCYTHSPWRMARMEVAVAAQAMQHFILAIVCTGAVRCVGMQPLLRLGSAHVTCADCPHSSTLPVALFDASQPAPWFIISPATPLLPRFVVTMRRCF